MQFQELTAMQDNELNRMANELKLKFPPGTSRSDKQEAIEVALLKRHKAQELKAIAELRSESESRLGMAGGSRPSAESVAIEASPKVYVLFNNMEHPASDGESGADVEFDKGGNHFHLWDSKVHVMPRILVVKNPDKDPALSPVAKRLRDYWSSLGIKSTEFSAAFRKSILEKENIEAANALDYRVKFTMKSMSLPDNCNRTLWDVAKDEKTGQQVPVEVGVQDRFMFNVLGPAPDDEPFGITDAKEVQRVSA
jgi:hypothetical protein